MSGRRTDPAGGEEEADPRSAKTSGSAARGRSNRSANDDCFAEAVRDVKPLAGRDKVRPQSPVVAATRTKGSARQAHFVFPRPEEPLLGHAGGIQRRQLERLRAGQIRPEASIDLHHLQADEACAALHRQLIEAHEAGQRCVIVIHGRALLSQRGPVLKRALPSWLTDAKVARRVLAFAPARGADGGEGATYVLLRRSRSRRP